MSAQASRYWLDVSDHAVSHSKGQYRVLGAVAQTGGTRDEAEAACVEAGAYGLAAPVTEDALRALKDVIHNSVVTEEIRRDAKKAEDACASGAPYIVHKQYEATCKSFCDLRTQEQKPSLDDSIELGSTEACAERCVDTPSCKCAFYTLKNAGGPNEGTCWLKGVPCDSEDLQRYDDSGDVYTHDNIQPCYNEGGVNTCCVHKLQRRYWVAGKRTGFDEPDCNGAQRNNGVWPYFPEQDPEENHKELILQYNNCGQDKLRNWAWNTSEGGTIAWRDVSVELERHWEPATLVPNGLEQPTGWQGYYYVSEIYGDEPGQYQNCTAAKVYVPGDHSGVERGSNTAFESPYDVAWWHDVPCDEVLDRWVCDFPVDDESSMPVAAIVTAVCVSVVLLLVAGVLLLVCCRRHRRRAQQDKMGSESADDWNSFKPASSAYAGTLVQPLVARRFDATELQTVLAGDADAGHTRLNAALETLATATIPATRLMSGDTTAGDVDGLATNRADPKRKIHKMLDSFDRDASMPFYGVYRLRKEMGRCEGGQGVVAFAVDKAGNTVAIKFFTTAAFYADEVAMYQNEALRDVLPVIHAGEDNADRSLLSPSGIAVAPFIVMDKGTPFDTWCQRSEPDFATALQVLMHIATKLRDMHQAGWAHRDVKNSNVIWNERKNSWELIDFATAARIGKPARLSFTLMFVAPEVIQVMASHQTELEVSGAVDVWAVGMMAWSMLTGESAWAELIAAEGFGGKLGQKMVHQLLGKSKFPWEAETLPEATRRRLGILRPAVLGMLRRDPVLRPTMQQLLEHWDALFQHAETKDSQAASLYSWPSGMQAAIKEHQTTMNTVDGAAEWRSGAQCGPSLNVNTTRSTVPTVESGDTKDSDAYSSFVTQPQNR